MKTHGLKTVIYKKKKWVRDYKSNYFKTSLPKTTIYLHREIYLSEIGTIPIGFDVHHRDTDKDNNDKENFGLMTHSVHMKLHGKLLTKEQREKRRENMSKNARPKANEWHGSAAGIEFHKKQYDKYKHLFHIQKEYSCLFCGKKFMTQAGKNLFCHNNCKSAYRRKTGIDNVKRSCNFCGGEFKIDKYRKTKTCSRSCTNRLRSLRKRGDM